MTQGDPFEHLVEEAVQAHEAEAAIADTEATLIAWLEANGRDTSWTTGDPSDAKMGLRQDMLKVIAGHVCWSQASDPSNLDQETLSLRKCELQGLIVMTTHDVDLFDLVAAVLPGEGLSDMNPDDPFVLFQTEMLDADALESDTNIAAQRTEIIRMIASLSGRQIEAVTASAPDSLIGHMLGKRIDSYQGIGRSINKKRYVAETEASIREMLAKEGMVPPIYLSEVIRQAFDDISPL